MHDPVLEKAHDGKISAVGLTLPTPSGGEDASSVLSVQSLPDPSVHQGTIEVAADARCFATSEVCNQIILQRMKID